MKMDDSGHKKENNHGSMVLDDVGNYGMHDYNL